MVRRAYRILSAFLLALLPVMSFAEDSQSFDGDWLTTVSCADAQDALGYSYRFVSTVKDGALYGLHGALDEPGSLAITGKIGSDGTAKLYADGRTGSKEYVPGRDTPRGTEYGYDIEAHFDASRGTGRRLEGRPCTIAFDKQ